MCVILTAYGCLLSSPARFRCPGRDRRWSARRVARFFAVVRRNRSKLSGLFEVHFWLPPVLMGRVQLSIRAFSIGGFAPWVLMRSLSLLPERFFRKKCPNQSGFELGTCTNQLGTLPTVLSALLGCYLDERGCESIVLVYLCQSIGVPDSASGGPDACDREGLTLSGTHERPSLHSF